MTLRWWSRRSTTRAMRQPAQTAFVPGLADITLIARLAEGRRSR